MGKLVGTGRGASVIGKFGDEVTCCKEITGDSWRRRHDRLKLHITSESNLAKVPVDCEVYGLFSDLLPPVLEEEGGELQWSRQRQGKVPDFKFLLETPDGPTPCLAELKFINAGKTWYPRGTQGKGTERRAGKLEKEYENNLRDYDVRFHGAGQLKQGQPPPPPGPLVTRFRGYGSLCKGQLVAGPWGDLSPHLYQLLRVFAEARVAATGRARGYEAGPGELGKVMGEIRRAMSVEVVRGHAICLLERLAHLGPGARAADQRRALAMRLEERRRRERQAYSLAYQQGGLSRVGRAFVA